MHRYPDEMICDLAETYGIYDYRKFGARYIATLVSGLRHDSRVSIAMAGIPAPMNTMLLARLVDDASFLAWTKTKDAQNNKNRPKSVMAAIRGDIRDNERPMAFDTPEDFKAARQRRLDRAQERKHGN